jgi:universal stress protein A
MPTKCTKYQHIVAAVDFSEIAEKVVCRALDLAELHQARLSVITVLEDMPIYPEPYGDFSVPSIDAEQWEQLIDATGQRLQELVAKIGLSDLVQTKALTGSPKYEISHWAEVHGADLIVMGSHGHRRMFSMLGSTTDGVIHRASCDVLTLRDK